ncbi:MAG: hypothetical protein ABF868_00465 [Sporolactobacillus sp.]
MHELTPCMLPLRTSISPLFLKAAPSSMVVYPSMKRGIEQTVEPAARSSETADPFSPACAPSPISAEKHNKRLHKPSICPQPFSPQID